MFDALMMTMPPSIGNGREKKEGEKHQGGACRLLVLSFRQHYSACPKVTVLLFSNGRLLFSRAPHRINTSNKNWKLYALERPSGNTNQTYPQNSSYMN